MSTRGSVRLKVGNCDVVDVRHLYPPIDGSPVERLRLPSDLLGIAFHHDAGAMEPGDLDYSGSTLNEDLERLDLLYRLGLDRGWGGMPYHTVASPNGRAFYTLDVRYYGAHVAKRNHQLVGLALMGNFTYHEPGDVQLCAAARATFLLWQQLRRFLGGKGHREWALAAYPTACPGDTWGSWQHRLASVTVAAGRACFPVE